MTLLRRPEEIAAQARRERARTAGVVRLGVIGLGHMGAKHAQAVAEGKIPRLTLAAICDSDAARGAAFAGAAQFASVEALLASDTVDAVLIATPHFSHPPIAIAALEAGLHVLVEKPVAVHKADAERMLAAAAGREDQVFGAMLNQRTHPAFRQIREMVRQGHLKQVRRIQWTVTDWFRTHAYYASGGWRATWAGEGGGVLLNQCPHQLDVLWWLFGRPASVRAFCHFGRHHEIEVEDEVTAYFEFAHGATATFIASTGEAPGINRLEITGDFGRLVLERERLVLTRNRIPTAQFSRTSPQPYATPPTEERVFEFKDAGGQHAEILRNFTAAILDGEPLLAPAAEGIFSVELANAMLLSTWKEQTVSLPLSGEEYAAHLARRIESAPARAQPAARTGRARAADPLERWRGKVALVTGASLGIGRAIARRLAAHGLRVAIAARQADKLAALAAELGAAGAEVLVLPGDQLVLETNHELFRRIGAQWGGLDVLVNNAGSTAKGGFVTEDFEAVQRCVDLNITAATICMREAVKLMSVREEGAIVNISSLSAYRLVPGRGSGVYAATKHALRALTEGLRTELAATRSRIKVAHLAPGMVDTERHAAHHAPDRIKAYGFRPLDPEDVADAVDYILATPSHVQVAELLLKSGEQVF